MTTIVSDFEMEYVEPTRKNETFSEYFLNEKEKTQALTQEFITKKIPFSVQFSATRLKSPQQPGQIMTTPQKYHRKPQKYVWPMEQDLPERNFSLDALKYAGTVVLGEQSAMTGLGPKKHQWFAEGLALILDGQSV